jgi:hypothetical protein
VFDFIVGLPQLVVFELVARLFTYQHRLLGFPSYQNPQPNHAHKGPMCSSIFSWI